MKHWPTRKLGELCSVVAGGTPSRSRADFFGGNISWVKIGDMLQGTVSHTDETISQIGLENSAAKLLPAGTVLISIFATIGRTAVLGIPAATNQAIAGVTPRSTQEITPKFLRYFLDSAVSCLTGEARGVAQLNINGKILKSLPIPVPPLPEQERIVKLLDEADELRKLRQQADRRTAQLIPALFHEMFGDPISNPLVSLKEIAADERSSFVNGPFGSDLLSSELTDSGVPVVYIRDISSGIYERKSRVCVNPSKAQELEFCNVKPGDVLVAKVGTPPGTAAIYPAGEPPAIVTQDVIRIRVAARRALPVYIEGFLNSSLGQSAIRNITIQATRQRFSLGQFKEIKVPLSSLPLQQEFAERVTEIRAMEAEQAASRQRLEALFQSMLHRAFDGEL
jgi:type I restriction enzyme S subunit